MENISGIFKLKIDGKERDLKCDFGTIENLERNLFKRPIIAVLNEALNGNINLYEVVDTIMAGLASNRDTRFVREDVGAEVVKNGLTSYLEWYLSFLTYAITGEEKPDTVSVNIDTDKKTGTDKKK